MIIPHFAQSPRHICRVPMSPVTTCDARIGWPCRSHQCHCHQTNCSRKSSSPARCHAQLKGYAANILAGSHAVTSVTVSQGNNVASCPSVHCAPDLRNKFGGNRYLWPENRAARGCGACMPFCPFVRMADIQEDGRAGNCRATSCRRASSHMHRRLELAASWRNAIRATIGVKLSCRVCRTTRRRTCQRQLCLDGDASNQEPRQCQVTGHPRHCFLRLSPSLLRSFSVASCRLDKRLMITTAQDDGP